MGDHREALDHWKNAMKLAADAEHSAILNAPGAGADFYGTVRAIGALRLSRLTDTNRAGRHVPAINFARACLRIDDKQKALEWLQAACEERNVYSLMIAADPIYDPLRTDPRFIDLLKRMKLSA